MSLRRWVVRSYFQNSRLSTYTSIASSREQRQKHEENRNRYYKVGIGAILGSVLIGASNIPVSGKSDSKMKESLGKHSKPGKTENVPFEAGSKKPDLPTYTATEVSKHDSKNSFWVIYKHGVYDVTEFLLSHPGGDQIYNAAGLSIEPFWNVYGMHKTQEVYKLLESYRIGNLHDDDVVDHTDDELWVREPYRDKRLIVHTAKPFNAEIPAKYQIAHFDTPNELFYVRQHMPVPDLDPSSHKLVVTVVDGGVTRHQFTLDELGKFRKGTVRAALMCAGNRRSEMNQQVKGKTVKGISWAGGAISNAVWSGVYLRDVLIHCGVDENNTEGKHVIYVSGRKLIAVRSNFQFEGSDVDATGEKFSTSIPLAMALSPSGEILLATHMNGRLLPADHGRPLRALVPGAPAVRSVKWLESITVSENESPSHWHLKDYRSFNASDTWETADFASAPPVYSLPVTSAICDPAEGDTVSVSHGYIEARGYAYSGGGAAVLRVDVSADKGVSWRRALLERDPSPPSKHYAWTLWTVRIPVQKDQHEVELWAKATDSNFNTQPEKFDDIWNIRGILSNAYHRIKVKLEQ